MVIMKWKSFNMDALEHDVHNIFYAFGFDQDYTVRSFHIQLHNHRFSCLGALHHMFYPQHYQSRYQFPLGNIWWWTQTKIKEILFKARIWKFNVYINNNNNNNFFLLLLLFFFSVELGELFFRLSKKIHAIIHDWICELQISFSLSNKFLNVGHNISYLRGICIHIIQITYCTDLFKAASKSCSSL